MCYINLRLTYLLTYLLTWYGLTGADDGAGVCQVVEAEEAS